MVELNLAERQATKGEQLVTAFGAWHAGKVHDLESVSGRAKPDNSKKPGRLASCIPNNIFYSDRLRGRSKLTFRLTQHVEANFIGIRRQFVSCVPDLSTSFTSGPAGLQHHLKGRSGGFPRPSGDKKVPFVNLMLPICPFSVADSVSSSNLMPVTLSIPILV
jgi:hypothetical protein